MAGHTPGPWIRDAVMQDQDYDICLGYEIEGQGSPIVIACVHDDCDGRGYQDGPITPQAARANAMLICAAPALLEACKAAVECTGGSQNWNGETEKFLKLCEEAIALATPSAKGDRNVTVTEADLQQSFDDLSAAIDRKNQLCNQLVNALEDVCQLAATAMGQANDDGSEYDIDGELSEARAAISKAKRGVGTWTQNN